MKVSSLQPVPYLRLFLIQEAYLPTMPEDILPEAQQAIDGSFYGKCVMFARSIKTVLSLFIVSPLALFLLLLTTVCDFFACQNVLGVIHTLSLR